MFALSCYLSSCDFCSWLIIGLSSTLRGRGIGRNLLVHFCPGVPVYETFDLYLAEINCWNITMLSTPAFSSLAFHLSNFDGAAFSTPRFQSPPPNGWLIRNHVWPIEWHNYLWPWVRLKVTFEVTTDKMRRAVPLHLQSFLLDLTLFV